MAVKSQIVYSLLFDILYVRSNKQLLIYSSAFTASFCNWRRFVTPTALLTLFESESLARFFFFISAQQFYQTLKDSVPELSCWDLCNLYMTKALLKTDIWNDIISSRKSLEFGIGKYSFQVVSFIIIDKWLILVFVKRLVFL